MSTTPRPGFRHWFLWAIALVIGSSVIARVPLTTAAPARTNAPERLEYLSQEVQADAVVESLNDMSKNGWDVFQIIPIWKLNAGDGDNSLTPKTFQVFARRPAP